MYSKGDDPSPGTPQTAWQRCAQHHDMTCALPLCAGVKLGSLFSAQQERQADRQPESAIAVIGDVLAALSARFPEKVRRRSVLCHRSCHAAAWDSGPRQRRAVRAPHQAVATAHWHRQEASVHSELVCILTLCCSAKKKGALSAIRGFGRSLRKGRSTNDREAEAPSAQSASAKKPVLRDWQLPEAPSATASSFSAGCALENFKHRFRVAHICSAALLSACDVVDRLLRCTMPYMRSLIDDCVNMPSAILHVRCNLEASLTRCVLPCTCSPGCRRREVQHAGAD